jgi:arsenite-transporting ATPase
MDARIERLFSKRLVFVGGKGGVGKTTVACALAVTAARLHLETRNLILSTDPAHSVRDALFDLPTDDAHPGNLAFQELDAAARFVEFRDRHREGIRKVALRGTILDEQDLGRFLDLSLPGLDELAALEAISQLVGENRQDRLFVDTAPTGHTLRLLALPGVLEQWHGALGSLMAKHRLMSRLFAKRYAPDEADAFISEIETMVSTVRTLLSDSDRTAFLPVMNLDPLSLWETARLLRELARLGLDVPFVLANRVMGDADSCPRCERAKVEEARWIERARQEVASIHQAPPPIVTLASWPVEPRGVAALEALGRELLGTTPRRDPPAVVSGRAGQAAPSLPDLSGPSPCAAGGHPALAELVASRLVLVCGKGGVGKTTVACALALRLASLKDVHVLLFSIDPAHSLSDALDLQVGPTPRDVTGRLDAVEIDPESRLDELKHTYRQEMGDFFDSLLSSDFIDTSLDREAMQRLIDLSPPGLDEVMALSELVRLLREETYDRVVIDTAPSGHFLRFLELPDLMRSWIRSLFELFLKYRQVFRAPRIQSFLVDLSRAIKEVQKLLVDPGATSILPVAIPTELSFEETRDLLERTSRLGLSARLAILNRIVREHDEGCVGCRGRATDSAHFFQRYREAFPDLAILGLDRLPESPVGVGSLAGVSDRLFGG